MPLTDEKLKSMLEIVNNKFPNWTGFDDPRFIREETGYKRDASKKAKELLSKEILSELLNKGDYDDFLKRIEKVGQSTNLLYLSTPKSGDMSIIYQESLNKEEFCMVFFNLLYGEEELKVRLKNYLHYVRENKLPNKFTFPTYFLFLLFPESEIFIKPTIVNKYGKLLDERNFDIKNPYFPSYNMVRQSMFTLKEHLKKYNPNDMIDIQSFILVTVKSVEDNLNDKEIKAKKGVNFLKYYIPIIQVLRELGGAADAKVVREAISKKFKITSEDLEPKYKSGTPKIFNHIDWARMYLVWAGYLDNSVRGVWKLTNQGQTADLNKINIQLEFEKAREIFMNKIDNNDIPIVIEGDDELENHYNSQLNYWLLAPGEDAKYWQDFQENNIISIGWDKIGDINQFSNQKDIETELIKQYDYEKKPSMNSKCIYEFANKIKIGDFVFIKQGRNHVLGFAKVTSDYYYDESRNNFQKCRKVEWIKTGEWNYSNKFTIKTLTNITKYPEMVDDLKKLIEPKTITLATNYWWLNSNPKIWTFRDMNIGAINDYKSFTDKGTKARIFKNFQNVQVNDKIIGYITSPENIIDGICEVTDIFKENSEIVKFEFKKIEEFKNPVSWHELKSNNELLNCEPMKNNQGSLFKLTKEEYDIIMDMVNKKNHPIPENEKYSNDDALTELFIEQSELEKIISTLKYKKNIILQGAPGVGKTFIAKRIAYLMMGEKDESRVQMIQFHQSYSYEDFIQGYRPTDNGGFEIKNGVFYEFCKKAQWDRDNDYFFIIDEINRGNLSKIFGELMILIEKDKRGKNFAIPLTYSKNEDEKFYLPENLYFIGTMNTADRSLAMVDYALRRRFGFITLEPAFAQPKFKKFLFNCNVPENIVEKIIDKMISLNEKISIDNKNLGAGYRIGHSFFCPGKDIVPDWRWYEEVIKSEIEPLLREYWFDSIELVDDEVKKLVQI